MCCRCIGRCIAEDPGLARGGTEMTKQQADCGRLAGAIWSKKTENLTRFYGQVQLVERQCLAEALGEFDGLDGVACSQGWHLGSFKSVEYVRRPGFPARHP